MNEFQKSVLSKIDSKEKLDEYELLLLVQCYTVHVSDRELCGNYIYTKNIVLLNNRYFRIDGRMQVDDSSCYYNQPVEVIGVNLRKNYFSYRMARKIVDK